MVPVDTCWIYWGHLSWSRVSPGSASGKESSCQCRRFDPWVQKTHWRRKWQPTPVPLPEKFLRQRSLAGYSPSGGKESDMTQQLSTHLDLDVWTQVTSLHHSQVTLCPAHSHWHTHTHSHIRAVLPSQGCLFRDWLRPPAESQGGAPCTGVSVGGNLFSKQVRKWQHEEKNHRSNSVRSWFPPKKIVDRRGRKWVCKVV